MPRRPLCLRRLTVAALLACLLLGLGLRPARAQGPAVRPAATHPAAAQLSPAQAQSALDVLRDDKRRASLISTLEAIAAVTPPAGAAATPGAPAGTPVAKGASKAVTPAAVAKLPLAPGSFGARLIAQVSATLANVGTQTANSLAAVNDLPLLWLWLQGQAQDPGARMLAFGAAWKLLVVVGAGLLAEWVGRTGLRRLKGALSFGARAQPPPPKVLEPDSPDAAIPDPAIPDLAIPDLAIPDPIPDPDLPEAVEPADRKAARSSDRQRRFAGIVSALRRLPFLFGRLLLDLVPILLFAVVGTLLLGTRLGTPPQTRLVIVAVLEAYVTARVVLAVAGFLVSPVGSRERLLHISEWAAGFLTRWIRRIAIVAIVGYGIAQVGLLFGMYRIAYEALLKLFALVVHLCVVVAILQARRPIAKRIHARQGATGVWAVLLNRISEVWHIIAIALVMGLWLVWAVELRNGYTRLLTFIVTTALVLGAARLVSIIVLGGFERLRISPATAASHPGLQARMEAYYPIVRGLLLGAVAVGTVVVLLQVWGIDVIGWFETTGLGSQAASTVSLIGLTVLLAVLVWEFANAWIDMHLARLNQSAQLARAGRLRTLLPMLRTVLLVVILLIVSLMALSELGLNIAPLLAGAGVLGIAVGFGSQKLVQDLITGLFLLIENAMQVGDVVTLGGLSGTVEALSIRTIRLRSIDGSMHIIPFSAVTSVTNQTRDYGYALLDVSVGLDEEPARIRVVLKEVAETMRADETWSTMLLEPLEVLGMDKFLDTAWVMRARIKTLPSSRWAVGRELNRRIKARFDELAIESPITSPRAITAAAAAAAPPPASDAARPESTPA